MSPKRHRVIRAGKIGRWRAAIIAIGVSAVAIGAVQRRAARTIPAQHAGSVTAKCKRGLTPVAGGFAAPGFTLDRRHRPGLPLCFEAGRKARHKGGGVQLQRRPARARLLRLLREACPPPADQSKTGPALSGQLRLRGRRCPHGRQAVGGGFKTDNFTLTQGAPIFTFTSKRAGKRGWKAAGLNVGSPGGGNPAGRLTAYAYCQKGKPKVRVRSKTVQAPALSIRNVDVKCPHRRKALSGGFNGHYGISGGGLRVAAAITSKRGARARAWPPQPSA